MKILSISSESLPFTAVSGLSRSNRNLAQALNRRGHDVRIVTALYNTKQTASKFILNDVFDVLNIPIGKKQTTECRVLEYSNTEEKYHIYLIENNEFFGSRLRVYDYDDDHHRFYVLSRAVLEWLTTSPTWFPDLIQCHDWHTGYFIELARTVPSYSKSLQKIPIAFTVHNFKYQGVLKHYLLPDEEQDAGKSHLLLPLEKGFEYQNPLLRGILHADALSTVSKTHAKEVKTKEYSWNLAHTLADGRQIAGIANGLNEKEFNPSTSASIFNYTVKNATEGKARNKKALQEKFGLTADANSTLISFIGRFESQKGIDYLLESLQKILKNGVKNIQFVALGSGEDRYTEELVALQRKFPQKVGIKHASDFTLPHEIYAGTDFVVVPSRYEPFGNVALEALRYGAVPLVRKTGGLADIVKPFDISTGQGNGFLFQQPTAKSLYSKMLEAIDVHQNSNLWSTVLSNCMSHQRTWDEAAQEYDQWFRKVLKEFSLH